MSDLIEVPLTAGVLVQIQASGDRKAAEKWAKGCAAILRPYVEEFIERFGKDPSR